MQYYELQKHNVETQAINQKKCILYISIYTNFESKQN